MLGPVTISLSRPSATSSCEPRAARLGHADEFRELVDELGRERRRLGRTRLRVNGHLVGAVHGVEHPSRSNSVERAAGCPVHDRERGERGQTATHEGAGDIEVIVPRRRSRTRPIEMASGSRPASAAGSPRGRDAPLIRRAWAPTASIARSAVRGHGGDGTGCARRRGLDGAGGSPTRPPSGGGCGEDVDATPNVSTGGRETPSWKSRSPNARPSPRRYDCSAIR